MSRYRVFESVGMRVERVRDYDDLEIHHPSKKGREPGRVYATVAGKREEVLRTRTQSGELMVSKDFILKDEQGSSRVPVPSPVDGYVGRVDKANGLVTIYDRPGGELLVQIRHMDLRSSELKVGDAVRYGQPLGLQSGFGKGSPTKYGVHVHMDFNAAHLHRFDRYLHDLDRGAITTGGHRAIPSQDGQAAHVGSRNNVHEVLEPGSEGAAVQELQRMLTRLGYRDASGRRLAADGDFGPRTREAVQAFQRDHRLAIDGRVGRETREALDAAISRLTYGALPRHPLHAQALAAVARMEREQGLPSGPHTERIAGVLAARAVQDGLGRIDRVELNGDRSLIRAVEVSGVRDEPGLNRTTQPVPTSLAAATSVEQSVEAFRAAQALHEDPPHQQPIDRRPTLSV